MEEESSIKSKSLALTRKIQRLHQALICNQLTVVSENVIDKLRNQCNYVETTADRVRRQNFPPKKKDRRFHIDTMKELQVNRYQNMRSDKRYQNMRINDRDQKLRPDNGYRNMRMNYQNQNLRIDDRNRNTKSGNRYQSLSSNERLINYNQEENLRSPYNDFTENPRIHKDEDGNLPARFKNLNLSSEDEEEFVQVSSFNNVEDLFILKLL
ncbi:hypothetical protein SSS_08250 [Sarcoptes scabiei]|uniref:Uncharacterized protein n=1 Tax=Sarcoptes scabiei TaxID=52283 RepID=A0A834R852_SARSC|nr:hypothetical protein SSS_08250 [Sarcoptes scabiei]